MRRTRRIVVSLALALQLVAPSPAWALSARPQLAVTFDDAPILVTPLLSTLQEKHAVATFFLVGADAEANPQLARDLVDAGMPIGNHSYDHAHFWDASAEEIEANLGQAQDAITAITGVTPRWFRAPYLESSPYYATVLPRLGLTISWPSINPKDWSGVTPESIVATVTTQARPGSVVILHDMTNRTNTIEALPDLIDGVRALGYDLCTLDDLGRGHIEGTVRATGGQPLSGAQLTAYGPSGSAAATATSDEEGHYRLPRLQAGSYRIGATCTGCPDGFYGGASALADATAVSVTSNYTTTGADVTLLADAVAPVTSVAGVPADWSAQPVTFSLSVVEERSPEGTETWYRLGEGPVQRYLSPVTYGAEGSTWLSYWSVDGAGNVEQAHQVRLRVDRTAPVTTSDGRASYSDSAVIALEPIDPFSGVAATYSTLDGASVREGTRVTTTKQGRHELRYWSVDAAGNREPERSLSFAVVAPTSLALSEATRAPATPTRATATALSCTLVRRGLVPRRIAYQNVRLEMRRPGAGWAFVESGMTGSAGTTTFRAVPLRGLEYRAVYPGVADTYGASTSGVLRIR